MVCTVSYGSLLCVWAIRKQERTWHVTRLVRDIYMVTVMFQLCPKYLSFLMWLFFSSAGLQKFRHFDQIKNTDLKSHLKGDSLA